MKPKNASARRRFESSATPATQTRAAPIEPTIGPASATRASFHASSGIRFIVISAPGTG